MKRLFILTTFLLGISPICLNAQELTLEECQQQAQAHYPLIKRYGLIEKTKEYNISNAGKGYLPQVSLSAKASYQSDVTEIYNPQIQISAESETKRSIFREKDKTKRSKKESAQHSKSRNKSFVMTSVSAL